MCLTCGCNEASNVRVEGDALHDEHAHEHEHVHVLADGTVLRHTHHDGGHDHPHDHEHHDHSHAHDHDEHAHYEHAHDEHAHAEHAHDASAQAHALHHHPQGVPTELVALEAALLDKNRRIAERNRGWFAGRGVLALNLMSSPGAGKTTLLVRTLTELGAELPMCVIEGDQETSADAERIRATGARAVQVNTGTGCHLEADMVERALRVLAPPAGSVLFVENVGNLVCPALFDLGERARVVVLSVTEGDDKPAKYPHMFRSADLMVTTKIDLAAHVDFDIERAEACARAVNPAIECLRVSSRSGAGLADWYGWLRAMTRQEALQ